MQQEEVEMEKKGARRHLVLEMLEEQGGINLPRMERKCSTIAAALRHTLLVLYGQRNCCAGITAQGPKCTLPGGARPVQRGQTGPAIV